MEVSCGLVMIKNNLMIDTDPIKQMFSQSFFDECCKNGTKLDDVKLASRNVAASPASED